MVLRSGTNRPELAPQVIVEPLNGVLHSSKSSISANQQEVVRNSKPGKTGSSASMTELFGYVQATVRGDSADLA